MIGIRSFMAKKETFQHKWYVIDATDVHLGRMASKVAMILSGKSKPTYTPHVDTGDFVVIINAEKVGLTGNKAKKSVVRRFSGYPGGLKSATYGELLERHPERLIERVIWGMLPKTSLGRAMYRKLKVYSGPNHPHAAQQPETLVIEG